MLSGKAVNKTAIKKDLRIIPNCGPGWERKQENVDAVAELYKLQNV